MGKREMDRIGYFPWALRAAPRRCEAPSLRMRGGQPGRGPLRGGRPDACEEAAEPAGLDNSLPAGMMEAYTVAGAADAGAAVVQAAEAIAAPMATTQRDPRNFSR